MPRVVELTGRFLGHFGQKYTQPTPANRRSWLCITVDSPGIFKSIPDFCRLCKHLNEIETIEHIIKLMEHRACCLGTHFNDDLRDVSRCKLQVIISFNMGIRWLTTRQFSRKNG